MTRFKRFVASIITALCLRRVAKLTQVWDRIALQLSPVAIVHEQARPIAADYYDTLYNMHTITFSFFSVSLDREGESRVFA